MHHLYEKYYGFPIGRRIYIIIDPLGLAPLAAIRQKFWNSASDIEIDHE